jgi:hypothetical protein
LSGSAKTFNLCDFCKKKGETVKITDIINSRLMDVNLKPTKQTAFSCQEDARMDRRAISNTKTWVDLDECTRYEGRGEDGRQEILFKTNKENWVMFKPPFAVKQITKQEACVWLIQQGLFPNELEAELREAQL